MSINDLPYRPNVCMVIFNQENKLLLGERYGNPGIFQFPQGGVEEKDSLEENVFREIEEELGIKRELLKIEKKLKATNKYDFQNTPSYAVGKWRGQEQTFWLVRFLGNDSDIDLNTEHPEFMTFLWCTIDEVFDTAEQRRMSGYKSALDEVREYFK